MLVTELNNVSRLVLTLCQVPNLKIFVLIDCKEFTYSCSISGSIISKVLCTFEILFWLFICHYLSIIEIKQTPLYLGYWILSLIVPNGNRCSIILIKHPINKKKVSTLKKFLNIKTYVIDPHEYAAKRYPLSLIDRAVGEFKPRVSIFVGFGSYNLLSTLNNPSDVEKKNS